MPCPRRSALGYRAGRRLFDERMGTPNNPPQYPPDLVPLVAGRPLAVALAAAGE